MHTFSCPPPPLPSRLQTPALRRISWNLASLWKSCRWEWMPATIAQYWDLCSRPQTTKLAEKFLDSPCRYHLLFPGPLTGHGLTRTVPFSELTKDWAPKESVIGTSLFPCRHWLCSPEPGGNWQTPAGEWEDISHCTAVPESVCGYFKGNVRWKWWRWYMEELLLFITVPLNCQEEN